MLSDENTGGASVDAIQAAPAAARELNSGDDRKQFLERFPAAGDFLKEWDALHDRIDRLEGILAHHGLEGPAAAVSTDEDES